jgi:hypothetical protein
VEPSDEEIREVIFKMGADRVSVVHINKHGHQAVYVSFHRYGGCGRIHDPVCRYMKKRFKDKMVYVLQSPRECFWCYKARVREPGPNKQFSKTKVLVTANLLDWVDNLVTA